MTKRFIFLTQGKVALVDPEDAERVNQFNWYYNRSGYAYRRKYLGGGKKNERAQHIAMHRFLMDDPKGFDIDHINGNKLDNRRSNLRVATRSQNIVNVGLRKNNSSGHKGVYWQPRANKWQVTISESGKSKHLGYFDNIEEAARAFRERSLELHGEFVR